MIFTTPVAIAPPKSLKARQEIFEAAQALSEDYQDQIRQRWSEIAVIRRELAEIAREIGNLRRGARSLVLTELRKYGYDPDELRVPRGNPDGGQWTRIAANDDSSETSDDPWFPEQPYGEGHHWVPKVVYQDRNFSNVTKAVFDRSKSGALANPKVNQNTIEHIAYNKAVDQLLDGYLERNEISEEQMTPAQAEEFVQEVLDSSDPVISSFVRKIRWETMRYNLRYGPARRGGGGDED